MSNEQNATPIDDQLIIITAIARAAGYDDGAAWIEKQATVFVERELAESEPSKMSCSFCANTRRDVKLMIAGHSAFICDECVRVSVGVVAERTSESTPTTEASHSEAVKETNAQAPANGAHPFGACCPMKAPPFCPCPCHTNPVTEPMSNVLLDALTEPANAPACKYHGTFNFFDDARGEALCSECKQPIGIEPANEQGSEGTEVSAQQQRTEDATERAHAQGSEAASQKFCAYNGCGNTIPDDQDFCGRRNCGSIASRQSLSVSRLTARERDDALERAAEALLAILARMYAQPDGSNLVPLFDAEKNLRSVLAQRAKGRA